MHTPFDAKTKPHKIAFLPSHLTLAVWPSLIATQAASSHRVTEPCSLACLPVTDCASLPKMTRGLVRFAHPVACPIGTDI